MQLCLSVTVYVPEDHVHTGVGKACGTVITVASKLNGKQTIGNALSRLRVESLIE